MCSGSGKRGSWTSRELFEELNQRLDLLGGEDLSLLPAESLGDDVKELMRIGNRVEAEAGRRLRHFDKGQGYAGLRRLWRTFRSGLDALARQPDRRCRRRAGRGLAPPGIAAAND
jgi:hypothetical protein